MILSASFTTVDGSLRIAAVLSNNLLAAAICPTKATKNRLEPIPDEEAHITYRKIDRGSSLVMTNTITGDIYVTGSDKLLKKYDYPQDKAKQVDWKRAPPVAVEEHESHSIGTNCWDFSS